MAANNNTWRPPRTKGDPNASSSKVLPPTPAYSASLSYPVTSGGLYDLDTLDEDMLTPTGPSPAVVADLLEPTLDNLRALNKSKAKFQDLMRAADAGKRMETKSPYVFYSFWFYDVMRTMARARFVFYNLSLSERVLVVVHLSNTNNLFLYYFRN